MPQYTAPLRDMNFVLHELLQVERQYRELPAFAETDRDIMDSILDLAVRFSENELAPLNRSGDEEGCVFRNGEVTTPKGFKEAYAKYVEMELGALSEPVEYGGHGLPHSLAVVRSEMVWSANRSWGMFPCVSHGVIRILVTHGSQDQAHVYVPKLVSGEWTASMCLTESHAGSDLGLIRSRAEANADGSYSITGNKIFISSGEHDYGGNIIHLVLARLPDAPKGSKGISMFVVPKFLLDVGGGMGERNTVSCGSIEHKMGLKGSATCVMNFDAAKGFLIGEPNKGLGYMFILMNSARLGTALQGVAGMESSYQGALSYAKDRLAMRSASGVKVPEREADPIIVHPAVRSMLLTQKAFAEGGRALVYWLASLEDIVEASADVEQRKAADSLMGLMTPIAKAFLTEMGLEVANHGIQVYGGHGFVREWGMEQILRDARVATLYEGTTQIQALDLLGRKVLGNQGADLKHFTGTVLQFCNAHADDAAMQEFVTPLVELVTEWDRLTQSIGARATGDPDEIGAAAVDYLYFAGYVTLAWFWAKMAKAAQEKLVAGTMEPGFYQAKIQTAQFYFQKILPRTKTHSAVIDSGAVVLMQIGNI
ncbi:MAG TPA: acyl-CoA dehydrogenase [Moraxellaceae bacterium]|nr:acyl-CoA dehydrogenase [Moraxellaceae bacterium]